MGVVYPFAGIYKNLLFSPSPHLSPVSLTGWERTDPLPINFFPFSQRVRMPSSVLRALFLSTGNHRIVQAILFRENENPVRQTCSEASPSANNKKEEASRESLETLLRRILREELSSVSTQAADETEVPQEMMNFLSTLAD